MMASTAADVLVETLLDWEVDTIFGLPGDGINGIIEALRVRQDKIRFIQVRHEESAAFMACAYAKFTGKLGVCLATSGPGALHLLAGEAGLVGDVGEDLRFRAGFHRCFCCCCHQCSFLFWDAPMGFVSVECTVQQRCGQAMLL